MQSEAELKAAELQLRMAEAEEDRAEQKICSQTLQEAGIQAWTSRVQVIVLMQEAIGGCQRQFKDRPNHHQANDRVRKETEYTPGAWHAERRLACAAVRFLHVICSTGAHTLPTEL